MCKIFFLRVLSLTHPRIKPTHFSLKSNARPHHPDIPVSFLGTKFRYIDICIWYGNQALNSCIFKLAPFYLLLQNVVGVFIFFQTNRHIFA